MGTVATKVPSTTGEENYKWLGKMPRMREWVGDREIQNLQASDYTIKTKTMN
ncbi:Mu-like prophage major head subunit gpT family protein [Paenibacillus melissococcoides]|uniref:Mu-like prophage major head subunit gpT family protein n=1 Tax=Paenibacillus melissococcoides TaxID=2912268 RepID=UPI0021C427C2|nr:Mu-like prophage major head subunit gpT family protein [Paenibacillus melissococcoides]